MRPPEPFRELEELQEQTAQLLESVLGGGAGMPDARPWVPPVDIEETDDAWIIEAELPGVDKQDVDVDIRENELVIHGEIKEKERKGIIRRRTRRVGEFEFRVMIPGQLDPGSVDAKLDDGVLMVRVPKPAAAQSQRINVTSGSDAG
jgi:HSP20 family protein